MQEQDKKPIMEYIGQSDFHILGEISDKKPVAISSNFMTGILIMLFGVFVLSLMSYVFLNTRQPCRFSFDSNFDYSRYHGKTIAYITDFETNIKIAFTDSSTLVIQVPK